MPSAFSELLPWNVFCTEFVVHLTRSDGCLLQMSTELNSYLIACHFRSGRSTSVRPFAGDQLGDLTATTSDHYCRREPAEADLPEQLPWCERFANCAACPMLLASRTASGAVLEHCKR